MSAATTTPVEYEHTCGRQHPDDPTPCGACTHELANDPILAGSLRCQRSVPPGPDWGGDPLDLLDCDRTATFLLEVAVWEKGSWIPDCWTACNGHVAAEVASAVGYTRLRSVSALNPLD